MNPKTHSLAAALIAGLPLAAGATTGPAISGLVATADDAETAAKNPAGLTRLDRAEWVGGVRVFYADSESDTTLDGGPSLSDDSSTTLFIPAVYYARPLNEDITLGISLTVPSGLGSDPGNETAGRYLLDKWSLGYVSLAPAVGYRVNEKFSVGATVNFNYAVYDYETAVFNGIGEPDGTMKLSASDFGIGFQLGLLYEFTPTTRIGLNYRSSSTSDFSDTPELSGLTPEREAGLEDGIRSKKFSLESKFPQALVAGIYHQFPDGKSATVDVAWVDFSQYGLTSAVVGDTSIEVQDKKYDDIWAVSAGFSWPLDDRWTMRVGAAYASAGIDDQNRSFAFRLDRVVGAGVGAQYQWDKDRLVGVNLTYYDLGDGRVDQDIPLVGTLSSEYSSNYALGLDFSIRWLR